MTSDFSYYELHNQYNAITSPKLDIFYLSFKNHPHCFLSATPSSVFIWNIATNQKLSTFKPTCTDSEITCLHLHADASTFSTGYSHGAISIWTTDSTAPYLTLHGQKGAICSIVSTPSQMLLTASQDGTLCFWSIVNEKLCKKVRGHVKAVTALVLVDADHVVSVSRDMTMKIWSVPQCVCVFTLPDVHVFNDCVYVPLLGAIVVTTKTCKALVYSVVRAASGGGDDALKVRIEYAGEIGTEHRASRCALSDDARHIALYSGTRIDIKKIGHGVNGENHVRPAGYFENMATHQSGEKIGRVVLKSGGANIRMLASFERNKVDEFAVTDAVVDRVFTSRLHGHGARIRSLVFRDSDYCGEAEFLSAAGGEIKGWRHRSGMPVFSAECESALCCLQGVLPNKIVVGCSNGNLCVVDEATACLESATPVHTGSVVSLGMFDKSAFYTASTDKTVKVWTFAASSDVLSLRSSIELPEAVVAATVTPDARFVIVSALDAVIRVFYGDTLNLHVSLYGHKFPACALDVSADSEVCASGGADKSLRIWGLRHGDCHRSMRAHASSITALKFIGASHTVVTASADGDVKVWDVDKFCLVYRLGVHVGGVSCLAVSSAGDWIATAGISDFSLFLWKKTTRYVVPEEQAQLREEQRVEEEIMDVHNIVSKSPVRIADRIYEAVRHIKNSLGDNAAEAIGSASPALGGRTPVEYVMDLLCENSAADLETVFSLLSMESIEFLVECMCAASGMREYVLLCCRLVIYLSRAYDYKFPKQGDMQRWNDNYRKIIGNVKMHLEVCMREVREVVALIDLFC